MLKKRVDYLLKHNSFAQRLYKVFMGSLIRSLGLFVKMDNNLVVYNSMVGRTSYGSPRAIYDYLISHPQYRSLKHVWAFTNPEESDLKCKKVKLDTLSYFITCLRAKYWVTDVNIERGLRFKKKHTLYINTWHGLSFNHVGNAVPGRKDYNCTNVDFFCYESEYHKNILMRDFIVREESMLPSGLPRNDELYNVSDSEIQNIKQALGIPLDKKLIMYAPTWRDSYDKGADYILAPPIDFKMWEKELGNDYIVLLRTHHFTTKLMNVEFNDFVRDVSSYPRINDLFKISDILISDYSACIADFAILERPVICFAYDYDEYKAGRGLYIDFHKEMPNGVFATEESVVRHIQGMDYEAECEKTRILKNKYTYIGGNATEICVKAMFG